MVPSVSFAGVDCVHEPMSKPAEGARHWSGSKAYQTKIKYNCGPYAKFESGSDLIDEIAMECQWNKLWSKDTLPSCKSKY